MTINNKFKISALAIFGTLACSSAQALSTAAGEPDSLQSRMFADDYERALTEVSVSEAAGPVIGVALELERLKVNGRVIESQIVPLSYTVRSDLDPRRQTTTSLRITHGRSNARDNYSYVAGVAFRRPINDQWTVVPSVSVGYVEDGSGGTQVTGSIYAVNVASVYKMRHRQFDVAIANQLGHYRTRDFRGPGLGITLNPELNNTVMRNGVVVAMPTVLSGRKLSTELAFTRTDILTDNQAFGFVDYYNEVSLTLGNNKRLANARSFVRGGISYLDGQGDVRGVRVKLGYWF